MPPPELSSCSCGSSRSGNRALTTEIATATMIAAIRSGTVRFKIELACGSVPRQLLTNNLDSANRRLSKSLRKTLPG